MQGEASEPVVQKLRVSRKQRQSPKPSADLPGLQGSDGPVCCRQTGPPGKAPPPPVSHPQPVPQFPHLQQLLPFRAIPRTQGANGSKAGERPGVGCGTPRVGGSAPTGATSLHRGCLRNRMFGALCSPPLIPPGDEGREGTARGPYLHNLGAHCYINVTPSNPRDTAAQAASPLYG